MRSFFIIAFFCLFYQGFSQKASLDTLIYSQNKSSIDSAESIRKEGNIFYTKHEYDSAILKYQKALVIFRQQVDSVGMAKCYNNLGTTFFQMRNGQDAVKALYTAVVINKKMNNGHGLVVNYINLGSYYMTQEEYSLAKKYYLSAKNILENSLKEPLKLALVYVGLGNIFSEEDYLNLNYDSAYYFYSKAITVYSTQPNPKNLADVYMNIGVLFERQNENDSALVYYNKSLKLKEDIGYEGERISTLLGIGNIYRKQGNYGIALNYFNEGLGLTEKYNDDVNYLNFLTNIIKCKIKLGDLEEADLLFAKYNSLSDSIFDQEKARQLKELETIYETEKTGKELEEQIRQTRAKTRLSYWFLAIALSVIFISVLTFLFFAQRQRFRQKIKDQELERIKREQEIKELNAMMQGQEEERNRIAEDLHDRLGARLSAIKLLSEQHPNGSSHVLTEMLEASIKETREISHNLSTDMLTRFGLENALKDLVNTVNASNTIEGDFTTTNLHERLPMELERPFYHMISELVNNTLKHAQASSFFIQITRDGDILSMLYEDDGNGFELESVAKNGMGMKNLRARVEGMHGELHIDTSPGNGMHVMVSVPIVG